MYFKWNFFYETRLWKDLYFPLSHTGIEWVNKNKAFFFQNTFPLHQFSENSGITLGRKRKQICRELFFRKRARKVELSDIWSWISVNFSEEILVTIEGTRKRWPESNGFPHNTPKPNKGLTIEQWVRHSQNSNPKSESSQSRKKIQVFPERCKD